MDKIFKSRWPFYYYWFSLAPFIWRKCFFSYFVYNSLFWDFDIFEKDSKVGGVIDSEKKEDYVIEWGPRGIRPKGNGQVLLELVEDLGLWSELVFADNNAKKRWKYRTFTHTKITFKIRPW